MFVSFSAPIPAGAKLYYGWGSGRLEAADGSGQGHAVYDNVGLPIWGDAHGLAIDGAGAVAAIPATGSITVGAAGGSYTATVAAEK